jgi:hypothetical protein
VSWTKNGILCAESRAQVWKYLVLGGFSRDHLRQDVEDMNWTVGFKKFGFERIELYLL